MKGINSNDIARLAGVSRSTVSRVINGYSNVPDGTREKVMKVIRENHYYPHISGRLLNGMSTQTLGLFWCGNSSIAPDPLASSYFMHIIDAAAQRGYLVLSCILSDLRGENAERVRQVFMEGRIDAGVFVGADSHEPLAGELTGLEKIVGLFDYYHENEDMPNRLSVSFDRDSGEKAVDYLYSLGHCKIAVIGGDLAMPAACTATKAICGGSQSTTSLYAISGLSTAASSRTAATTRRRRCSQCVWMTCLRLSTPTTTRWLSESTRPALNWAAHSAGYFGCGRRWP